MPKRTDSKATRFIPGEEAEPTRKPTIRPTAVVASPPASRPLDLSKIKRARKEEEEEIVLTPRPVAAGPVDKIVDAMFNPTRYMIRGVTVIDRFQGRMFPQLDMCGSLMHYCLEVAQYREDSVLYEKIYKKKHPTQPDAHDEFLFSTSLWNRSIGGKTLDAGVTLAQAEVETRGEDDGMGGGRDPYGGSRDD